MRASFAFSIAEALAVVVIGFSPEAFARSRGSANVLRDHRAVVRDHRVTTPVGRDRVVGTPQRLRRYYGNPRPVVRHHRAQAQPAAREASPSHRASRAGRPRSSSGGIPGITKPVRVPGIKKRVRIRPIGLGGR